MLVARMCYRKGCAFISSISAASQDLPEYANRVELLYCVSKESCCELCVDQRTQMAQVQFLLQSVVLMFLR